MLLFNSVKLELSLLRREVDDCGAPLSGYSGWREAEDQLSHFFVQLELWLHLHLLLFHSVKLHLSLRREAASARAVAASATAAVTERLSVKVHLSNVSSVTGLLLH